jgi:hypothetical protein
MATRKVRKDRAMETQRLLAELLREQGIEFADTAGAGRPGRDLLNWPGVAAEVKATAGTPTVAALRQTEKYAAGDLPLVIYRPPGYGPDKIMQWPVTMRLETALSLLRAAGLLPPE